MAVKQLYPNQRPTLNLIFARSKTLDPRITFTRNSTATYVGSDGLIKTAAAGEARFDHDPVTGECRGLLVEEGRTNYATNSTMESSDWQDHTSSQSEGIIISSNNAAPDGTNTAVLMGEVSTGSFNKNCYIRQNLTVSSAGDYVISVFAKRSSTSATDTVTVGLSGFTDSNPAGLVRFRMDTLEWSSADTAASYADRLLPVEDYGNGWYRISVKWNLASTGLTGSIRFGIAKSSISGGAGVKIYRNDDNWGYFWGAQVEKSSFLTSYMPTSVGSTTNRVAEEVSITGTNFSSWYSGSEGTMVMDMIRKPVYSSGSYLEFYNNAGFFLQDIFNDFKIRIGQESDTGTLGQFATTTNYRIAAGYTSAVDFKFAVNGGNISGTKTTAVNFNNATELHIGRGNNAYAAHWRNGPTTFTLRQFAFYPTRLTDSQLQELTR